TILIERITSIANEIKKDDPEEQKYIEFLEIMEGRNRLLFNRGESRGRFSCEYVQAALVYKGDGVFEETGIGLRKIRNFFTENACDIFTYKEYIVLLFEETPEAVVRRLLEKLYDHLEKTGSRPVITLGRRCRNDESGSAVFTSCRDAEELMDSIFFFRNKKYLSRTELPERKDAGPERDIAEKVPELRSYIQVIDHKKIRNFFKDLEGYFFCSGKNPREIRQECMALFIETRNDLLNKIPPLKEMLGAGRETLEAVMRLKFLGDIMETMADASVQISECLPLLSADSGFQRIISYVKNNYREDLKLETLGRLFNYNCAYLGKRFKDYTGKHFHTYLDILRVEAAKELLRNTAMKVYEISAAVGYTNTDYFYSKFKKHAGESPLDFRKNGAKTQ
ncbi:MAG: helix-turn-helix domain-containing protein, partial [Spirochaetaceae bacterium]|nr:helix-turn-helix domain-containing protein [Spirochaetaceae bacterium]